MGDRARRRNGAVTSVAVDNPGQWFDAPPIIGFSGGGGTGAAATATIEPLANPVCAALTGVLNRLIGMAVVGGPDTSRQAAIDWRETLGGDRLIPVDPAVKVLAGTTETVVPASVAGGGRHRGPARPRKAGPAVPLLGQPAGPGDGRPTAINFSLTDGATEGQRLLSSNVGVLLRGEMGVETAIASGGFVFVGTDNAGEERSGGSTT